MGEEKFSAALPKTLVLSYVTNTGSPTRVRRVAVVGVLVLGVLNFGLGVIGGICTYDLRHPLTWMGQELAGGNVAFIPDFFIWYPMLGATLLLPMFLIPGLVLLSLARLAGRGNKFSCRLVLWCMIPSLLGLITACVLLGGWAILDSFTGRAPQLAALCGLIWLVPLILLILVVKDLAAFVRWIGRNPTQEKPKVAFLHGVGRKS